MRPTQFKFFASIIANNLASTVASTVAGIFLFIATPAFADLPADVDAILKTDLLAKGEASVIILRLGDTRQADAVIYTHNDKLALIPASNQKLLSTAAALETLGSDFKFSTRLAVREGAIAIIGDGDPSTGDSVLFRDLGLPINAVYAQWAEVLKQSGVKTASRLVIDDSVFGTDTMHPSWPLDQANLHYVAQVGGLNLNANCLDIYMSVRNGQLTARADPSTSFVKIENRATVGVDSLSLGRAIGTNNIVIRGQQSAANRDPWRVTINDPALFAGNVFAATLKTNGIAVESVVRDASVRPDIDGTSPTWEILATNQTAIDIVLAHANKESANLYAEALARRTGFARLGDGSWEGASRALGDFLISLGIESSEFTIDDGSGLSRKNRISAHAMATILAHMHHSNNQQTFFDSLSIGGEDGTLSGRFKNKLLQGKVRGKSGFIRGVSSLSGYVKSHDGSMYAFSILINGVPTGATSRAREVQDKIVNAIEANTSPPTENPTALSPTTSPATNP